MGLAFLVALLTAACEIGDSGEESGTQYGIDETYNETRNGARLGLDYDLPTNSFVGTVENTTSETLDIVRVEVHLSNGVELGPTTPTDIPAGGIVLVILEATDEPFETYSAHPEVGGSGDGGEHDESETEHSNDGESEHDG